MNATVPSPSSRPGARIRPARSTRSTRSAAGAVTVSPGVGQRSRRPRTHPGHAQAAPRVGIYGRDASGSDKIAQRLCHAIRVLTTPTVMLGHYRLGKLLGRGGMGEVYRAYDGGRGRDVALKLVKRDVLAAPDGQARFRREFRLAARLSSPHVIPIHDYG